jgi:hypothetical protein
MGKQCNAEDAKEIHSAFLFTVINKRRVKQREMYMCSFLALESSVLAIPNRKMFQALIRQNNLIGAQLHISPRCIPAAF